MTADGSRRRPTRLDHDREGREYSGNGTDVHQGLGRLASLALPAAPVEADLDPLEGGKIGRASCRERVCYVV